MVHTGTPKARLKRAILRQALEYLADRGGGLLGDLVDLLADLPPDVSRIDRADRMAAEMANSLRASMVIDPLFGSTVPPTDPGELLRPGPGRRARVSVVSLAGLASDALRQAFVSDLQVNLFTWVKQNPARGQPLSGLLVMDEAQLFAPSRGASASSESTQALVVQARKYGLGMVFATQGPKDVTNKITNSASTHVVGRVGAQSHVQTVRDLARVKGGNVDRVGRLKAGESYVSADGQAFTLLRSPLCLSHHPQDPLTPSEVVDRANGCP